MCYSDSAIDNLARTIIEGLPESWGDLVQDGHITINLAIQADTLEELIEEVQRLDAPRCRVCGCTDDNACPGGCYWVEDDLCSECVEIDRLQDAAPDMLAALEEIKETIGKYSFATPDDELIWSAFEKAKDAIAKAKGARV